MSTKCLARTVPGRVEKSLLCEPGFESRLGGRENRRAKMMGCLRKTKLWLGLESTGNSDYQNGIGFETAYENLVHKIDFEVEIKFTRMQWTMQDTPLCAVRTSCSRHHEVVFRGSNIVRKPFATNCCCCCLFDQRKHILTTRFKIFQSPGCTREDSGYILRASSTPQELKNEVTGCVRNARVKPRAFSFIFIGGALWWHELLSCLIYSSSSAVGRGH